MRLATLVRAVVLVSGVAVTAAWLARQTVALAAPSASLVSNAVTDGNPEGGPLPFGAVLLVACALAVLITTAWAVVAVAAASLEAVAVTCSPPSRVRSWPAPLRRMRTAERAGRLCPGALRRLVLTACGAAVTAAFTATPVQALPAAPSQCPGLESSALALAQTSGQAATRPPAKPRDARRGHTVLDGLRLPDRVSGLTPAPPTPSQSRRSVTVHGGESLWTIAERLLPRSASNATTWATAQRIYRQNRVRIGSDPDLILAGAVLRVPPPDVKGPL